MRFKPIVTTFAATAAVLLVSCSSGPSAPQPGSPGYYWAAARDTFSAGDYSKTSDNLEQLTRSPGEYTARALPWELVVVGGAARGLEDLADSLEIGGKVNRSRMVAFHRPMSNYRTMAGQSAVMFADLFARFQRQSKDDKIPLAFPFPGGSMTRDPQIERVEKGVVVGDAELDALQRRESERGVLIAACEAAGSPGDPAQAEALFKNPTPVTPRSTFLLAMAASLFDQAGIFSERKLGQTDKQKILYDRALEAVKGLPESKEGKKLTTNIQASLKKIRIN
ncbi:MAG: hypothetical protein ACRD9L_11730 [Bryobacteraceae bacterium]